ncbi:MAG: histidinol dehydrogenase [Spirochaetaceae bacterium]|jgi:histidinol dehydrogenase/sulfopropanediol 3-dehydrogenase|nr:histidinol dehydrogenase [Spirochaetaceae bacterium]
MGLTVIKQAQEKSCLRDEELSRTVRGIIDNVRARGEAALLEYAEQFDKTDMETVRVGREMVLSAYNKLPPQTIEAMRFAHSRIKDFAERQRSGLHEIGIKDKGVELSYRLLPVESCGCYVPAGRHPLPSSALMSITTAKAAGVRRIAACSPPSCSGGGVHPSVLAAMDIAGADEIYCMGGAGAIAAFAYGFSGINAGGAVQKVDMIAGPGNRFVTEAKRQVIGDVGIDGFAGPSEVLIIADKTANPKFIAADLLAQAEHDTDAQAELVCMDKTTIDKTLVELEKQLALLPTKETAALSWADNGKIYLADTLDDAIDLANRRAPEHIELQLDPETCKYGRGRLNAYGSLFAGHYAPAAFGDFVSGTNHILPTMGSARFTGALWAGSFLRAAFYQSISKEGCAALAGPCVTLAETEGLFAHRRAVEIRLDSEAARSGG